MINKYSKISNKMTIWSVRSRFKMLNDLQDQAIFAIEKDISKKKIMIISIYNKTHRNKLLVASDGNVGGVNR